jgi:hypothetical protein
MGDYAVEITRSDTAGAQRPQKPPTGREKPAVAALRRTVDAHQKAHGHPKRTA